MYETLTIREHPHTLNMGELPLHHLEGDALNHVSATLDGPMPRGRGRLFYRTPLQSLDQKTVDGKKHIVFAAYYPNISFVKKSHALRRTGNYFTSFIGCCAREDNRLTDYFDQVYEVRDYREMFQILANCRPHAVHAASNPAVIGLMAGCTGRENGILTLIDINDSMLFLEKDGHGPGSYLERTMLGMCDTFTHKMPAEAIQDIRKQWGVQAEDALCHALPENDFFCENHDGTPGGIVFAGGLIPYDIAARRGHEGHLFDSLIRNLCHDSLLDFTMYVHLNARDIHWNEHAHYLSMTEAYPNFQFKKGVPFFKLPHVISTCGYGLYYENFSASTYNPRHHEYNMPTKVFSYIEAGLPVLVPEHALYLRQFTEKYGISVIYDTAHPENISRILEEQDYSGLVSNVRAFRESQCMKNQEARLEAVYS